MRWYVRECLCVCVEGVTPDLGLLVLDLINVNVLARGHTEPFKQCSD